MKIQHILICAGAVLTASCSNNAVKPAATFDTAADASGMLHVPMGYRENYRSIGSWSIAADQGQGAKQIHMVYASPGAVEAFKKDGSFPDGTVLVKEVYEATTAPMTTGTVSHAAALKGWFVMVRDSKDTHTGQKLWGEGWGWSWFDAANPTRTTSTDFKTDCLGCHEPARKSGLVYTEGYPSLK